MSDEYKAAEQAMLSEQCADADVIITTALIPNRPAPILVKSEIVEKMRRGSVIVDLAAQNGGNVEATVKNKVITTKNGVTVIGYENLASRLPSTASTLFGNNVAKFLLSAGPTTGGPKGEYKIDYGDDAVRGMLVVDKGELTYPAPPYQPPEAPKKEAAAVVEKPPVWTKYAYDSLKAAVLASVMLLIGRTTDASLSAMLTVFSLAGLAGYQAVLGVPPALHSPLMSATNAISGMTAVGAMFLLPATAMMPAGAAQILGAVALVLSAINIAGGFLVTKKMLELFKRKDDEPEYYSLYALPAAVLRRLRPSTRKGRRRVLRAHRPRLRRMLHRMHRCTRQAGHRAPGQRPWTRRCCVWPRGDARRHARRRSDDGRPHWHCRPSCVRFGRRPCGRDARWTDRAASDGRGLPLACRPRRRLYWRGRVPPPRCDWRGRRCGWHRHLPCHLPWWPHRHRLGRRLW